MEEIIIKASEYEADGRYQAMFECLCQGLLLEHDNYELYLLLGKYYLAYKCNPEQALLCFENALFFCNDTADRGIIQSFIDELKGTYNPNVPDTAVVIVSYNSCEIMKGCLESIRANVDFSRTKVIIVDNGSSDGIAEYLEEQEDIIFHKSPTNLGFGKGSNLGVTLADTTDDIFFLNNDTILTPNALFWLKMTLYEADDIGTTGCYSNYPGNDQSIFEELEEPGLFLEKTKHANVPLRRLGNDRIWLSGFALLCKRTALDKTGLFDDAYGRGYYEDNDLSMKMLKQGYRLRACPNSVIYHYGSGSFKKSPEAVVKMLATNREIFKKKWDGIDLNDYCIPALNIVSWIKNIADRSDSSFSVLDYKCHAGVTLSKLTESYDQITTVGVEDDDRLYAIACIYHKMYRRLDDIDANKAFDFVITEHGHELIGDGVSATTTLGLIKKLLKSGGFLIFTISAEFAPELIQQSLEKYSINIRKINGIYVSGKIDKYIVITQSSSF